MCEHTQQGTEEEKKRFFRETAQHEPHLDPCFMTGKRCVYTEAIDQARDVRHNNNRRSGFLILPFRPNVRLFFDLCFTQYVADHYGINGKELLAADQVIKTGYIICKKIQESDFVVADVSTPNPNVFYELGLAFSIGQKVVVVYQKDSKFGQVITDYL